MAPVIALEVAAIAVEATAADTEVAAGIGVEAAAATADRSNDLKRPFLSPSGRRWPA
jgi:hypothetical protein